MNTRPIGVIDTYKQGIEDIKIKLDTENIVAICLEPMWDKDKTFIKNAVHSSCQKLIEKKVKAILCLDPFLAQFLPENLDIHIVGCVVASVQQACSSSNKKIGVLASPEALKTGCYGKAVRNIRPTLTVTGGYIETHTISSIKSIKQAIDIFIKENVDCVIIGKAITSVLLDEISLMMNPMVTFIEQNMAVCHLIKSLLLEEDMLNTDGTKEIEYIKEL